MKRILGRRIDQQRLAVIIQRKGLAFVVTVTTRARQRVIEPVEGPQGAAHKRFMVIDIGADTVAAVHAAFNAWRHPLQDIPKRVDHVGPDSPSSEGTGMR